MMLNVLQLPHASITASAPGLFTRRPTSKAVCGSSKPISRLRMNPSASCARTLTPFASINAATVWLTGVLQRRAEYDLFGRKHAQCFKQCG